MGFNVLLFVAFLLWAAWGIFLGSIVLANVIYKNDPEVVTLEVTCGSDRDYFLAFVDNQGKHLTDYYKLGDLPSKPTL